jgi:hypothetical protein
VRLSRVWVYIAVLGSIFTSLATAQIPAGVDTTRPVWAIRIVDSVGLSELDPMISQYNPPHVYGKWLRSLAECEGLPMPTEAQVSKLTFFIVNAESFQINGDTVNIMLGVVDPSLNRIYIALPQMWDQETIKHELLHMLLRWKYGELYLNQHPTKYFAYCGMHEYRSHR